MLFILAILIALFQSTNGEIVISSNNSLIRVSRQVDPHDPSHWRDIEGLPISEEAVNAGGYATPQCEPITVPVCQGAFYEYTRMPNILNHETQEEAGLEAHQFYPLIQINCSADLRFLMCSIYTPICIEGYAQSLPPCRSVCERARAGCGPIMGYYAFKWPDQMQCDRFPVLNNPEGILCMERNLTDAEKAEFESIQSAREASKSHVTEENKPLSRDYEMSRELEQAARLTVSGENSGTLKTSGAWLNCSCDCRHPFVSIIPGNDSQLAQISTLGFSNCALPCYSIHFQTETDKKFVDFWLWLWSALCAVSTIITMLTFLTDPSRFQYPGQPIIYLSTCYFFVSVGYILRMAVGHENVACTAVQALLNSEENVQKRIFSASILQYSLVGKAVCTTVFIFTYYFGMASSVWWVVLTVTWFLAAGLKWSNEAISKYTQVFHFVAWVLPGVQTGVILMLRAVDGDPVSGLCYVGSTNDNHLIYFLILPLVIYFCFGTFFLLGGFVALCNIRRVIKFQPRVGTDKLEKLMIKLGIFGLLYTVPAIVVIACYIHELRWRRVWQLGVACQCDLRNENDGRPLDIDWNPPTPEYAIFMLKYFMSLIVGITSGFWIWSGKTVEAWKRVCRRGKRMKQSPTMMNTMIEKSNTIWSIPNMQSPTQFPPKTISGRVSAQGSFFALEAEPRPNIFCPMIQASSSGIGGSSIAGSAYANTTSVLEPKTANTNREFAYNGTEFVSPRQGMY